MNDIVSIEEINGIKKNEENAFAFGFVENVKADMLDIRDKFFEIGFRLDEAVRLKYYKKLGFNDIKDIGKNSPYYYVITPAPQDLSGGAGKNG